MVELQTFVPLVVGQLHGCPDATIVAALRRAVHDFCLHTHAWIETLDPLGVVAGLGEYEIEPVYAHTQVLAITAMRHGERALEPIAAGELDRRYPHWDWRTRQNDYVRWWVQQTPYAFWLVPVPATSDPQGLHDITAALAPTPHAEAVGDVLYERYAEAIGFGALERLLRMPKQSWSEPQLANYYRSLYLKAKSHARIAARRGYATADLQVPARRLVGAP